MEVVLILICAACMVVLLTEVMRDTWFNDCYISHPRLVMVLAWVAFFSGTIGLIYAAFTR